MVVISILVPFFILLLVAILIATVRSNKVIEREDYVKNVFVYLVLFATLMMTIGGSIGVFMSLADIVSPAPYHQSFEEYRQWGIEYEDDKKIEKLSEEQLRENYEAMLKSEKEREMQRAVNALIKSFGWIVIPLPIFIYFQRKLLKEKKG